MATPVLPLSQTYSREPCNRSSSDVRVCSWRGQPSEFCMAYREAGAPAAKLTQSAESRIPLESLVILLVNVTMKSHSGYPYTRLVPRATITALVREWGKFSLHELLSPRPGIISLKVGLEIVAAPFRGCLHLFN